jgi:hypothetical protein
VEVNFRIIEWCFKTALEENPRELFFSVCFQFCLIYLDLLSL